MKIQKTIKRSADIMMSIAFLFIFSIPMGILYVVLAFHFKENPIFKSVRAKYRGDGFVMYKFRTMRSALDSNNELRPDSERVTELGQLIRRWSLDELPQLLNVLKGDMSLIGPRPLPTEYNELYTINERKRLEMKPGMTGWAQVNGRNNVNWKVKFQLDVVYVTKYSLLFDLKICLLTIMVVLKKEGISQDGHVSAERYKK
ncbi:sugar transferase [Listeria booriae]|uniref:Sugar transferase n=1 Tax=Listeria booriae TaxID=1552123 RepID=A0A7X1A3V1_9LIST|nr:sugar transferase [Listeria booriae]MBC1912641.1 sugar transferase [Listeria booriae]MBC1917457.1 sugar transferase [Listeria booriae]MBC2068115.1 sugar transferase [Listeria booriae]MBC2079434.1 sugar transferase [Listeria booriae]MBC2148392.1 sugar transferase [Listeria booriae]